MMPVLTRYGRQNFVRVECDDRKLWFSYSTLIGFAFAPEWKIVLRKNPARQTTARHLNQIAWNAERLPQEEFEREYDRIANDPTLG